MRIVRGLIRLYGTLVIRVLARPGVRIEYCRREKEEKRGCVYICNHRASSDAFLMALLNTELVQVVNRWPFKIPVIGWVAEVAGYLNVRSMPFEEFLEKSVRLLKEGVSIAAFPEGSRSPEKTLRQFHGAVFRAAFAAQAPIVPVCIHGNDAIPSKGSLWLTPGVIRVERLPAVEWETYRNDSPFQLKQRIRQKIQDAFDAQERL